VTSHDSAHYQLLLLPALCYGAHHGLSFLLISRAAARSPRHYSCCNRRSTLLDLSPSASAVSWSSCRIHFAVLPSRTCSAASNSVNPDADPSDLEMRPHASPTLFSTTLSCLTTNAFRVALLAVLLACFVQPASAANQTVGATDSRLAFQGRWTSQGQGAWQFTEDPTASVSLTFTG
jgi:hypothetical protein